MGRRDACPTLRFMKRTCIWIAVAVGAFHAAYGFAHASFLIVLYLFALLQLARAATWRQAFYPGLAVGLLIAVGRLGFFWRIFGGGAAALGMVYALWIGLFVALARLCLRRVSPRWGWVLVPFVWAGLEYFRSELYYLRFSWLNAGYTFADAPWQVPLRYAGMYGLGFLLVSVAAVAAFWWQKSLELSPCFQWNLLAKSEGRRPKSERSPKPETRSSRPAMLARGAPSEQGCHATALAGAPLPGRKWGWRLRPSGFGLLSDFGLRPSDFTHAAFAFWSRRLTAWVGSLAILSLGTGGIWLGGWLSAKEPPPRAATTLHIAGTQMEFPTENEVLFRLNDLIRKHPDAEVVVLSEYTFDGPLPEKVSAWCRKNRRYLIAGGKDPAPGSNYYNTAFVVGPDGKTIFRQVKTVPIQFFKDGLAATEQRLWNSPWGKIGICICYDLSYTRVTDQLVRLGAQALIVPTMDMMDWGETQHALHARVAPVRAAEYGIPIFRLASSGISQCADRAGRVLGTAPCPGDGAILAAQLVLAEAGRLPLDRWLGPFAAGLTGVLAVVFLMRTPRRSAQPLGLAAPEPYASPDMGTTRHYHRTASRPRLAAMAEAQRCEPATARAPTGSGARNL
jgi:apolipoprotein N-acyltransferase